MCQPPKGGDSDVAVSVGSPPIVVDVLEDVDDADEVALDASAAALAALSAALSAADSRRFRSSSPSYLEASAS